MNIKEPKVFKYLALGIFCVIPIFVFFGFKANIALADTKQIPTSTLNYETNWSSVPSGCVGVNPSTWITVIDRSAGIYSDWEGEMTFNLKDISRFATISSVPGDIKVCSYGAATSASVDNYIQKISSSICDAPPDPFNGGATECPPLNLTCYNNNVSQITQTPDNMGIIGQANINSTAGWKCINIDASAVQPVVAQAPKGQNKYLYLRWWGQDINSGVGPLGPLAQYKGPGTASPATNCPGNPVPGAANCAPYIEINYTDSPNLCTAQHTVRGEAWSENIGWIRFSCLVGDYLDYGVEVNFDTEALSGYAWSENIGWISFNRSETGSPPDSPTDDPCPDGSCIAKLNIETNEVSGWARACSVFQSGCSGTPNPNAGGWDGWIKLRGQTTEIPPTAYGVWRDTTLSPRQLRDWAWSDNVIGWVSFNCRDGGYNELTGAHYNVCGTSDYKVIVDSVPPTVTALPCGGTPDPCYPKPCEDALHPVLSWNYQDGTQGAWNIQISNKPSSPDWDPATDLILNKTVNPSSSCTLCSYTVNNVDLAAYGKVSDLSYGTTYSWQVKAKKSGGDWSDWSTPAGTFTTSAHELPDPFFTHYPQNPPANQEVTFTDNSTCYDSGNNSYPCKEDPNTHTSQLNRYQWDFESDGAIDCDSGFVSSPCRGDVTHTYTTEGTRTVKLSITDSVGTCPFAEPVSSFRLPQWKEVSPTGWVNKFLASVSSYFNHLISP